MTDAVTATVINGFIKSLISDGKKLYSEAKSEVDAYFKSGISRYLQKQSSKYSTLKTLLHGNTPKNLYDIYYPLKLSDERNKTITTTTIDQVFAFSNFIAIIGDAGSGKSTLIKHLFLNSIRTHFAIPVLVELRYLNDGKDSLKKYIIENILENKIQGNERIIERLLENGEFVFFLDGYDELSSATKQPVVRGINSLVDKYPQCKYILTSRPYSDAENIQRFCNLHIKELTESGGEIRGFIFQQLKDETELAKKIADSIKTGKSEHIKTFLTNPLLLSLYILTFQNDASIPDKKCIFYRRVINSLFFEHDSKTKVGYVREKLSGLNQEQFEDIQKKFCFISYFEGRYSWDPDYIAAKFKIIKDKVSFEFDSQKVLRDLKSAIALWIEDNGIFSFAHRSLQEYFAALLVSNLGVTEKNRAYKRITERLATKAPHATETQNLLSLLEELDPVNFAKLYRLPVLKELRKLIDPSSRETLVKSTLAWFCRSISVRQTKVQKDFKWRKFPIFVNPKVYQSIYVHLSVTQPLHDAILDCVQNLMHSHESELLEQDAPVSKAENLRRLRKFSELSPEIQKIFVLALAEPAISLNKFVDEQLQKCTEYISISDKNDSDLVDLI